ncbi:hypothetical protein OAF54_00955 [bacterium]|nr:hypothetical protein [bacterium]
MSILSKFKKWRYDRNDKKTRPTNLFMQHRQDGSFWTYHKLSPEAIMKIQGGDCLTHAYAERIKQDENGCWVRTGEYHSHPTRQSEEIYRILEGGNYKVKFDPKNILQNTVGLQI